jgi:hypothetical protein
VYEDANSDFFSLDSSIMASTSAAAAAAGGDVDGDSTTTQAAAAAAVGVTPDAVPQGVAAVVPGQYLLLYPDRPLRVPVVQDEPVFTEDAIIQRQTALMKLATAAAEDACSNSSSSSSGTTNSGGTNSRSKHSGFGGQKGVAGVGSAELLLLKQRLLSAPLLSDMCAFKAANPGCCFHDFVRWYSPKDWQQQQQDKVGTGTQPPQQQQDGTQQQQQDDGRSASPSSSRGSSQASSPVPAAAAGVSASRSSQHQLQCQGSTGSDDSSEAVSPQAAAEPGLMSAAAAVPAAAAAAGVCGVSARMESGGAMNAWQQLWGLAEPQPAAAQRPLLNPHKEGEQVKGHGHGHGHGHEHGQGHEHSHEHERRYERGYRNACLVAAVNSNLFQTAAADPQCMEMLFMAVSMPCHDHGHVHVHGCVMQVLHYLETLGPLALFDQLLAAAVAEALTLLGSSRGAQLPAAAAVMHR